MATIDERVVSMKFDNAAFGRGVEQTKAQLEGLKRALNLQGATQGLENVDGAARRLSFSSITDGVSRVQAQFSTLQMVGVAALAGIANQAITTGATMMKSLTTEPIMTGFQEYETQMNAVQTILANTQSKGSTLTDVNSSLGELNEYADKTIYNFTEMTRNIGTFTAAGTDLDTSTAAIKGIANLAALSGSSSEQASTAMYQLSQALAAGKVGLQDWNSVVNAGMGGQVFQDALKDTARASGVAVDEIIASKGSFRESLQEGWITSDIMTKTLNQFTGDMTDAQLLEQGFSQSQVENIQKMATTANDAATKVKTFTQLVDTLKESVQSSWAQSSQLLFGDFEEAKAMFTAASDSVNEFVGQFGEARNELLKGWKDLGGRDDLIAGIGNVWKAFVGIFKAVGTAFREIFPPTTSQQLFDITKAFSDFTAKLVPSNETIEKLTRVFKGVFAVLDIGRMIVVGIAGVFLELFGVVLGGSGSFLDMAAGVGDAVVAFRDFLSQSGLLKGFFATLGNIIKVPIAVIGALGQAVGDFFNGADFGTALVDRFSQLGGVVTEVFNILFRGDFTGAGPFAEDSAFVRGLFKVREFFTGLGGMIQQVFDILFKGDYTGAGPFAEDSAMVDGLFRFRDAILQFFNTGNFNAILDLFNTGFLAGLVLMVKKFMDSFGDVTEMDSIKEAITGVLDGVSGSLTTMQNNVKADTLMKIAAAVGILAVSVIGLSMIDSESLSTALGAITVMFVQLGGVLVAMDAFVSMGATAKLPVLAAGLILLSTAVGILSLSVMALSQLSWEQLAIGLTGVGTSLMMLSVAANIISMNAGGLIQAGIGLTALAAAVNILAQAVQTFSAMSWESMVQGLIGVASVLVSLGIFTNLVSANAAGLTQSAGLLLLAAAINVLAGVVQQFGAMDIPTLVQGMIALAGALGILAAAMTLMPVNLPVTAMGLIVVSGALVILAGAMMMLSGMSWDEIARGLTVLAGSLILIAGAMMVMSGAVGGAAALVLVAGALSLLVPPLIALSLMSFGQVVSGLLTLAAAFTTIGIAGAVLTPLIPSIMGLGVGIGLLGIAVMAAGVGVSAFASGLIALSGAAVIVVGGLTTLVTGVIGLIPAITTALAAALIGFATAINTAAPAIVSALVTVLQQLLQAIVTLAPDVAAALQSLVNLLVQVIQTNIPQLAAAGLSMLVALLQEIEANIGQVVDTAINIITNFLDAISANLPQIANSGADLVISFVNSMASTIESRSGEMRDAGNRLAGAIVDGATGGLGSRIGELAEKAAQMARSALDAAKNVLGIHSPSREFFKVGDYSAQGMGKGLDTMGYKASDAASRVGRRTIDALKSAIGNTKDLISDDVDLSPRITPVLDLSEVKKSAGGVSKAIGVPTMSVDGSYSRALNARPNTQTSVEDTSTVANSGGSTFIQNNYSPKSLSPSEIYRQSRSLLAQAERK